MTSYHRFHLAAGDGGFHVVDSTGKLHGWQPNRNAARQLLEIIRHMALAGGATSDTMTS